MSLKRRFQVLLHQKLRERYGRLPGCPQFARDFSLIAKDVPPISSETARKWLRGYALPHASRLNILCQWLEIDLHMLFDDEVTPPELSEEQALIRLVLMLDERERLALRQFAQHLLNVRQTD